jgi:hypothetical protein
MESGQDKLLFSVREIAGISPVPGMESGEHYFNHLLFNPDSNRFMFFHIWNQGNGDRKIRLLTSDLEGRQIRLLNESGHVSHYCWKSGRELLAYSTVDNAGEHYFLYRDDTNAFEVVGKGTLIEDGHPTFFLDGNHILTDTYPDRYGEQSLILYSIHEDQMNIISKEYSPPRFSQELRCDLHPRKSLNEKYVCIDCIHKGRRVMKVFDIGFLFH